MKVLVDIREKRSKVPELLQRLKVPIEFTELEVGDYIVGDIAIERKTINDYLDSLASGRLHTQLYHLSRNYKRSYLVIIGYVSEALMFRKFSRKAYISSLVGASLKRAPDGEQGIVDVVVLENDYDFAYFVYFLWDKLQHPEPRLPRHGKKGLTGDDELVYVLSSIQGVGEKKAEALLRRFKTLRNVFNAPIHKLMEVEGIGETLARKIYETANRVYTGRNRFYKR